MRKKPWCSDRIRIRPISNIGTGSYQKPPDQNLKILVEAMGVILSIFVNYWAGHLQCHNTWSQTFPRADEILKARVVDPDWDSPCSDQTLKKRTILIRPKCPASDPQPSIFNITEPEPLFLRIRIRDSGTGFASIISMPERDTDQIDKLSFFSGSYII